MKFADVQLSHTGCPRVIKQNGGKDSIVFLGTRFLQVQRRRNAGGCFIQVQRRRMTWHYDFDFAKVEPTQRAESSTAYFWGFNFNYRD